MVMYATLTLDLTDDSSILPMPTVILAVHAMVALRESRLVSETRHLVQEDGLVCAPSHKATPPGRHQSTYKT